MVHDKYLEAYLKKLMEKEGNTDLSPLSDKELQQIAFDTGLSENEWQDVLKEARYTQERGFNFLEQNNIEDAIAALSESTSLYPNSAEAFYGLAKAYLKKGIEKENHIFLQKAIVSCERVFTLDPNMKEAMTLQSQIRSHEKRIKNQLTTKSKLSRWKKKGIILIPIILLLLWVMITYNRIISQNENVENAWAQVENVCESRYNKVPQLVKVVKSAAAHEEKILQDIIDARNIARTLNIEASNLKQKQLEAFANNQERLRQSLHHLISTSERYPQLQSMEAFLTLQDEIAGMENRIAVEKRNFNLAVKTYNQTVKRFPALLLPFDTKPYYKVDKTKVTQPILDL